MTFSENKQWWSTFSKFCDKDWTACIKYNTIRSTIQLPSVFAHRQTCRVGNDSTRFCDICGRYKYIFRYLVGSSKDFGNRYPNRVSLIKTTIEINQVYVIVVYSVWGNGIRSRSTKTGNLVQETLSLLRKQIIVYLCVKTICRKSMQEHLIGFKKSVIFSLRWLKLLRELTIKWSEWLVSANEPTVATVKRMKPQDPYEWFNSWLLHHRGKPQNGCLWTHVDRTTRC